MTGLLELHLKGGVPPFPTSVFFM